MSSVDRMSPQIQPRVRLYVPWVLDPEEIVRHSAARERIIREQAAAVEAAELARLDLDRARLDLLLTLAAGESGIDVEAASRCRCGCHPSPGRSVHSERGCECQLSPEQLTELERDRSIRVAAARARLSTYGVRPDPARFDHALATVTASLELTARVRSDGVEFVVSGMCDGRGWYLRERDDLYRVTIAPDGDPGSDPWDTPATTPKIDIAEGDIVEITSNYPFSRERDLAAAITVAADAVRLYLLRLNCIHEESTVTGHRFCCRCGIRLREPDRGNSAADDVTTSSAQSDPRQ
jgi:hypothetical protein